MARYNFEFARDGNSKFVEHLSSFNMIYGCSVKQYLSKNGLGYHYMYNLTIENNDSKCSFAIGVGLNSLSENKDKGFIEFNPNKCYQLNQFVIFLNQFIEYCSSFDLVRYDCAIDIPLKRNQVKMIRNLRSNYEYLIEPDKENSKEGQILNNSVTEYQGRRNHNKFTKLYDKTAESHLDYDLTRIEFTFERKEISFENLPKFFVYDNNIINDFDYQKLTSNEMVIVDLLRNSPDINYYLKNLSYRFRKKIEPYLCDLVLKLDIDLILSVRDVALSLEF